MLRAGMTRCRSFPFQVASALLACAGHKNPNVRAKAALHLDACVHTHDAARLAAAQGLPERLFAAAAGFLDEGSPEARCSVRPCTPHPHPFKLGQDLELCSLPTWAAFHGNRARRLGARFTFMGLLLLSISYSPSKEYTPDTWAVVLGFHAISNLGC